MPFLGVRHSVFGRTIDHKKGDTMTKTERQIRVFEVAEILLIDRPEFQALSAEDREIAIAELSCHIARKAREYCTESISAKGAQ